MQVLGFLLQITVDIIFIWSEYKGQICARKCEFRDMKECHLLVWFLTCSENMELKFT